MREYDPRTGRLALKSSAPTTAETYEARGEDGRAEVIITGGARRKQANGSKGLFSPALKNFDPNDSISFILTGPYHPAERTKKEAEEFYRPPAGVPFLLGGPW
jgi:hypothetical protein